MDFLNFFISSAFAQTSGGGAASATGGSAFGGIGGFLPLIIIFVLFYFLLIRPQSKRQKEHKQMLEALGNGDEVVTGGGLLGKITAVGEQFLTVELADGVVVQVQKGTISSVVPKGTIKNL